MWPTRLFLALAALWGAGLVVAAATVPVYSGTTTTCSYAQACAQTQVTKTTSATLVEVDGNGALAVVALPLVPVLVAAASMHRRFRKHAEGAGVVAWLAVALVGTFTTLGALTIGIFVAPLFVLLMCACTAASVRSSTPPGTRTQNLMIKSHLL